MRSARRIHPYVTPDQEKRLRALAAAENVTQSALVQAAIQDYLDRGDKDNALIIKRLDRLASAHARSQRDLSVFVEAFSMFVRWWAMYPPELPPSAKDAAQKLSERRYQEFLRLVARNIDRHRSFVSEVVKDGPLSEGPIADAASAERQGA